jgi:ATP-dependent Lon protease
MSQFLIDDLKREVVLRPQDPAARFQLAEALFGDSQYAAAIKQLERAMSLDPEHLNARRLLARAYEREGRGPDALRTLEEMVRRDPDDLSARDELMEMLLSMGRVDDALLHAEEALKTAARDPKRFVTVAELCRMKGLVDRARTALEEAQRLAPEDRVIAESLKELYLDLGDEAASERVAGARDRSYFVAQTRQALANDKLRTALAPAALTDAAQKLGAGDVSGGKRALMAASSDDKLSAAYEFLRGEVLLIEGDHDRAEKAFRTCVERANDFGVAWNRLGDLTQSRGKLRDAVAYYKKAVLFSPDDANAYEDLGDLYATLGDREQAEKMYAEADRRDPSGRAAAKLKSLVEPAKRVGINASDVPEIGRIHALAWTPLGGSVSPLQAVAVMGRGELIFSGNIGPAAKESSTVAFSCLKALARKLAIDELMMAHDLHLHATDTEKAKDGASAGLALVLAGVSAYTQLPLRPALAATGEITIMGDVKPIGGLREKVIAAHLAGLKTVILPRLNLRDGRDLPVEVAAKMQLIYVDSVQEAIEKALVKG